MTVPPSATVPPPDNPEPASTVKEGFASIAFVTPAAGILMVPVFVMDPPVKPAPVATLVTVPPELGAALVSVTVPPSATVPPPDSPEPATTVTEEFASIAFVTPAAGILIVPLLVIGPPVRPAPVPTLVTVAVPGKVCPDAKVRIPFPATDSPVCLKTPPVPYSKLSVAEVLAESFPTPSACQRKSYVTGPGVIVLNTDAWRSRGIEANAWVVVAMLTGGIIRSEERRVGKECRSRWS